MMSYSVCYIYACKFQVEIWNIHNVIEKHGPGNITFDEATVGVQPVTEFEKVCICILDKVYRSLCKTFP